MAAKQPFRQNLTGAQGTTLTGSHGGTQQLGAAAQRRLQTGQPGTQPPTGPPPGARTPPPFDPATLKPGAGGRDPATGGMLSFPGGPGQISFPGVGGGSRLPLPPGDMMTLDGSPGQFPGGVPGIASMDGTQNGQAGPPGMFDHTGQQLGVQGPGDAGNIDNAISSLRAQLGVAGGPAGAGGGSGANPATDWMSSVRGEMAANNPQLWNGSRGAGPGFAGSVTSSPNFGKPLPNGGAAGVAAQPSGNPYAALLRSRLGGGGAGGGSGVGGASLRGY